MRITLQGDPRAPAAARRFVATQLEGALGSQGAPSTDDVLLVVSELVTNAVRAEAGEIGVSLEVRDDRVEVEVADDAGGWPTPRTVEDLEGSGRGLAIVDHLADSWQATRRHLGKSVTAVWFRESARAR